MTIGVSHFKTADWSKWFVCKLTSYSVSCIIKSKTVSTAVVGLEPWVSGKLNELLRSKDDTARPQGLS